MAIKKNDFVELEYTGRVKEGNVVFDTTDEATAKKEGIHSPSAKYGPVVICIGEGQILKGLDEKIEGKELGRHTIELKPEEAFGKKNAKLIQLVPTKKFREQNIVPVPGLQVNIDGIIGTVRTVTGGRTIVDFNHPLSGKEVIYEINIKRVVTDKKEQLASLFKLLGVEADVVVEGNNAKVLVKKQLPQDLAEELKKKFGELTGLNVEFAKQEQKKELLEENKAQKNH